MLKLSADDSEYDGLFSETLISLTEDGHEYDDVQETTEEPLTNN